MAFAVEAFDDVSPLSGSRLGKLRYFLSGAALVATGIVASTWMMATFATMQTVVGPLSGSHGFSTVSIVPKARLQFAPHDRLIHVAKASRLSAWADGEKNALTADAVRAHGLNVSANVSANAALALAKSGSVVLPSALAAALVGQSPAIRVAEGAPSPTATATLVVASKQATSAKPTTDDAVKQPVSLALADPAEDDRVIVPSKGAVAAAEMSALVALADAAAPSAKSASPIALPAQAGGQEEGVRRPTDISTRNTSGVELASAASSISGSKPEVAAPKPSDMIVADASPSENDVSGRPFGLVLAKPADGASVPLPMARPDGFAKRALPGAADRTNRPAEPVLAYARPDDEGDDDGMQRYDRRIAPPLARNGVAVYDISANIVYLPSGERLEAHSGLGKMRDNPRYVDQKMRGPTPPHTYDLTMRESLFHGVQALRLNPVGGAGNIHNRVGLLAHTYMLGARGDSNGCVSFKDYKRFLAAFKRGDVKRLVVVPRLSSPPTSRFASLFSRGA
jgi:hypothetical protein